MKRREKPPEPSSSRKTRSSRGAEPPAERTGKAPRHSAKRGAGTAKSARARERDTRSGASTGAGELIPPEDLRWTLDPASLGFETTDELERLDDVPAQQRAQEALRVGAELPAPGYNVFCVGLVGADRMETVRRLLERLPEREAAPDRVYVQRFEDPEAPRLLTLPRGTGRRFARDVIDLIDQAAKHLALVLEEPQHQIRVREVTEEHRAEEREILERLHELAGDAGFAVAEIETNEGTRVDLLRRLGRHLLPLDELESAIRDVRSGSEPALGETPEEEEGLVAELQALDLAEVRAAHARLSEELRDVTRRARILGRSLHRRLAALERDEAAALVRGMVEELAARHAGAPEIREWLGELESDVLENLHLLRRDEAVGPLATTTARREAFARYRVHVLRDNGELPKTPIVVETAPTPRNLFGATVREGPGSAGEDLSPQCNVRSGSVLEADGGWLVLDASESLAAPETWTRLKRTLLHGRLDLRDSAWERPGAGACGPLRPDPIPLTTKVCMLGDEETYDYLDSVDEDFKHVFRVRAEFDWLMARSAESARLVGRFVRRLQDDDGLTPFDAAAVAALAEQAARVAEHPGRMVSRFDLVADVTRQAALCARREGASLVGARHVDEALEASRRRCALGAERLREAIADGRIMIATEGERIGQVNALAVRRTIEHAFGHPLRVTAVGSRSSTAGILSIEREVQMSGSLHDKGVYVAQGFLAQRYGREQALSFSASIAFEQLYGGIEGDSASSAVIYALLSALSDTPLRQSVAVTGSVNQFGEIQAVGGVNEKTEGFYDACLALAGRAEDLPGDQGVLLPRANAGELMLRPDVVQAVRDGRFFVRAIDSIDDGLEILTGLPAGRDANGEDAGADSVHGRVMRRLDELAADDDRSGGGPAIAHYAEGEGGARRQVEP